MYEKLHPLLVKDDLIVIQNYLFVIVPTFVTFLKQFPFVFLLILIFPIFINFSHYKPIAAVTQKSIFH